MFKKALQLVVDRPQRLVQFHLAQAATVDHKSPVGLGAGLKLGPGQGQPDRAFIRPGGLVITLRDHVISGPSQLPAFFEKHPLHHLYGGENAFEIGQYRTALTDAGLRIKHELGSLASVINYAPMTQDQIRKGIADQVGGRLPFLAGTLRLGLACLPFGAISAVATSVDRRPGRLVSFICEKGDRSGG